MTTLAHRSALRRAEERRRRRPPRGRPLGLAHVPPRVAPADPGDRAPHGRGRGRDRQHHASPTTRALRDGRVRLGQPPAQVRRHRSAGARGGAGVGRGVVRDDRRHRPPLGGRSRRRRDGGLPLAGPGRALRRRAPRAPPGQLPGRARPGRRHRRRGRAPGLEIGATLALDGRRGPSSASSRTRAS